MRKLPGFEPAPAGWERIVLRKLPGLLVAGTVLPLLFVFLAPTASSFQAAAFTYAVIGFMLTLWMLLLVAAIACVIVILMKGHAWVADAYELPDSESPASHHR